jgi:hypothetical protein
MQDDKWKAVFQGKSGRTIIVHALMMKYPSLVIFQQTSWIPDDISAVVCAAKVGAILLGKHNTQP